jgi:hypothetical protein
VFGPLGGASELWLLLAMPVPGGSDQVLRPAGEPARFRVSSPCLEAPVDAVGAGTHSVSLRLDPGAGGSCELRFESNAAVREGTSGRLRAPAVQVAAWSAR